MRILLLLLLSSAVYSQQYNYQSITYSYFPTDTAGRFWEKSYPYKSFFLLDSIKKRLVIPKIQIVQIATTRKDLVTGKVLTTSYDTTFSVVGRDTLILAPPYVINKDYDARLLFIASRVGALIILGDLFLQYPQKSKYIRCVQLSKNYS